MRNSLVTTRVCVYLASSWLTAIVRDLKHHVTVNPTIAIDE